jgi:hypothetical protein
LASGLTLPAVDDTTERSCQTNPAYENKPAKLSRTVSSRPAALIAPGQGQALVPLAQCERSLTKDELEFEIQFARDGGNPGLDKYHVHIRCFAAWKFERSKPRPS